MFLFCFSATIAQENNKIENLKTFAKVYGYVKYFHQVEKCQTKEQLLITLNELFLPIAPTIKLYMTEDNIKFNVTSITPDNPNKYKTTYWQHSGVDYGMMYQNLTYRSVRINRKKTIERITMKSYQYRWGNFMTKLAAEKYKGKKIKLTGSVKLTDGSKGIGHLWLRVDIPNSQEGFYNNMADNPIIDNKWNKYEIEGEVDTAASDIALGCFLTGDGELLADDMHLYYMDDEKWIEIPIRNSNFESEGISSSIKKTTWKHSGGGNYSIKVIDNSYEGKKCASIKKHTQNISLNGKKIFDAEPEIGEVINKNVGNGISCIIPLVLYCNKEHTYPISDKNRSDSILNSMKIKDVNLPVRLGDIIITWNVFQHFFPYFEEVKVDWEKELEKALLKCYQDKDDKDFMVTLQQFTAPLKDGHIWVTHGNGRNFTSSITWEFIENKLVITKVCDSDIKLKAGDIVTQINGLNPKKYFENVESKISAATPGWLAHESEIISLQGEKDSKLSILGFSAETAAGLDNSASFAASSAFCCSSLLIFL